MPNRLLSFTTGLMEPYFHPPPLALLNNNISGYGGSNA
jgi:hypothetical protein